MSNAEERAPVSSRAEPPFPAAITIAGGTWQSRLACDGHIPLAHPVTQIGRMAGNDIVLSDPLVSRYHTTIRWTSSGYELEDLASANGTYVQGRRVAGRLPLEPGQIIRLGNTELHFEVLHPIAPPAMAGAPEGRHALLLAPAPRAIKSPAVPVAAQSMGVLGGAAATARVLSHGGSAGRPRADLRHVLQTHWHKRYWRLFLLGLLAYFVVYQALVDTGNLHLVPLALLVASLLVPVVFVTFCWEQSAFADMPLPVLCLTFLSGAVLGLTMAAVLEPLLLPAVATGSVTLSAALTIGLIEESAKVFSVLWWLRDQRLRSELDGLILGAAAGMGFAALETAGYGFVAFLSGFGQALSTPGTSAAFVIGFSIRQMNRQLLVRMALATFGHGVWTAIVCAAIWRERRGAIFRLTPTILAAFAFAVGLHALWDWSPLVTSLSVAPDSPTAVLLVFGWFLLVGIAGLYVLGYFLREALAQAKLGPLAPPPPPLLHALFGARRPKENAAGGNAP
jgi:RsiW-degrading membrane proteinase PrsW (M82 family)